MELKCTSYLGCHPQNNAVYTCDGDLVFVRCDSCGLIWRSPGSLDLSKSYGEEYFLVKNYTKKRAHKIKKSGWLIDMALSHHPGINRILEIGCSVGNTLEAARLRNIDHLGIDVSQYAVEHCRKHGLHVEMKTLQNLKEEKQKFDLVFMQHVLEHFKDPFQVISDCKNLLNNRGLLLVIVPNANYGHASIGRERHRFYNQNGVGTEHFVYFNYSTLRKVLESQGFRIIIQNYPLSIKGTYSPIFFFNRIFRLSLTILRLDQELVVMAEKLS